MSRFGNTTLPDDFIEQVESYLQRDRSAPVRDVQAAILAVLHRPLTRDEKWAIIDMAANNSPGAVLDQSIVDRIARGGRD